jgi:quercetin dioxygenase-like cupin family protein
MAVRARQHRKSPRQKTGRLQCRLLPLTSRSAPLMSLFFPTPSECAHHSIFPGVTIRTCSAEHLMLSLATLEPHSVVAEHSHPHEQVGMVIEGRATFYIGDEEKTLGPGDMFRIPGNVKHRVVALDRTVKALDIFFPIREDYR